MKGLAKLGVMAGFCLLPVLAMPNQTFTDRLLDRINSDYWDSSQGLYRESFEPGKTSPQPAFNWSVGVILSALNALAPRSEAAKTQLELYLKAVPRYWNPEGPVPGFDVLPMPKSVDRYYDDNAWMALALFESAEVTGDKQWQALGLKALDYALSGESTRLGGGVYWRESDKASKNTCSNTPVAAACFEAFTLTGESKYKEAGLRLTAWTLKHLQDPTDGLMWDNIDLNGKVEKTKWSYNTALTIKAVIEGEKLGSTYSISGKELFARAWRHWFDPAVGMKDEGKFAHLLVEVGLEYKLIPDGDKAILMARIKSLGKDLRFGNRWDRLEDRRKFELIDQASVLRVAGLLERG